MTKFNKHEGYTLIELMIAMAVGLILVAAVLTLYVSMSSSNIDYLKSIRLNHELRSTMGFMVRDLRRAGHNQSAAVSSIAATSSNPFSRNSASFPTILSTPSSSSITYSYDSDADTNIEAYGFRLNNSAVEYCSIDNATTGAACTNWEPITDDELIEITGLTYTLGTTTPVAGSIFRIRTVTISLTGRLKSDTDFTRTITEVVKVRNDHNINWTS